MILNGELIKDARERFRVSKTRRGLTQKQAALRCGIALGTFNKAEQSISVRPVIAERICRGLRLNIDRLSLPRTAGGNAA